MTKPTIYTVAHPEDLSPPLKNQGFCVDVVLASDYAELERKLRAYEATVANLEHKVSSLAAENAVLREACGGDGRYVDCPGCSHSQYIEAPETPATDAAIAEFHAHGVEMFAEWKRGVADAYCKSSPGCIGESEARYAEREAKFYAKKLRGEASK